MLDAADVLIVLVALAGDQDHVGGRRRAHREADRLGPVLDHVDLVVADGAGQDLGNDEVGRLEARVVAGDHHVLGLLDRDRAHQRPLAGVAVAAAAEHAPQLPAPLDRERPERRERLLQRIGRVGVVDHHLGPGRVGAGDPLHAPRHWRQPGAGRGRFGQADAEGAQHAHRRQQVGDVVVADQGRGEVDAGVAFADLEGQAFAAVADVRGDQAGFAAAGDRPGVDRGRRQRGGELDALRIVQVDHGRAQPGPGEQLRLGLPVGDHVAVVVEVVLGEVGEHRHRDPGAGQAVLGDADRGRLDRAAGEAARREVGERVLQGDRVGRGESGRGQRRHRAAGAARRRRLAHAERADHRRAPAGGRQRLRHPPGGRGLAVGPGDRDDIELLARVAEKAAGDVAGGRLQATQRGDPRLAVEAHARGAVGLHQAGDRAGADRVGHVDPPVAGVAGPGDEGVAGLRLAAVADQAARLAQQQPGMRGLARVEDGQAGAHLRSSPSRQERRARRSAA
jgi:hypothetical protein